MNGENGAENSNGLVPSSGQSSDRAADSEQIDLAEELRRVKEINRALIGRVERSMNLQGEGAFTLFEAAISFETKVRERTAELERTLHRLESSNRDLLVAKENADAANQAKSKFLATMSHEIRTPMNGILATTELLSTTDLSDRQQRAVDRVHRSAETLLNIINDILDFSRLDADRLELSIDDFDLRDAVEGTVELLAEHAHQKGLELTCDIDPTLPMTARGDVNRICQILTNLVGNAVKFTDDGQISVRVGRHARSGDDATAIRIEVIDTGIGLTPNARQEVFHAFNQIESSMARRFGGSGLGLAISRSLVELMGGSIGVHSTPQRGSTFWFTVPEAIDGSSEDLTGSPWSTILRDRQILIVDENATTRTTIARPLIAHGAVCSESDDPGTVAGAISGLCEPSERPDVVLIDAMLHGEHAASIGLSHLAPPMILLHPPGHDATWPTSMSNIAGFLCKPLRQLELLDMVVGVISDNGDRPNDRSESRHGFGSEEVERIGLDVLLVEDNEINRETAVDLLEYLGCPVDVAAEGGQALEMIGRKHYDIVLMDCQMPLVDGYQATREIRRKEEATDSGRRIPIIAMTGNAMAGDRQSCLDAGMDDFLSKPYTLDELRTLLTAWRHKIGAATAQR